jgi:hypothetical protein
MDDKSKTLDRYFESYEKAFSRLDAGLAAGFYAECAIATSPVFLGCTKSTDELRAALTQAYAFYKKVGMESTRILGRSDTVLDPNHVLARVRWAAFFRKTGDAPITFEISYLVRLAGETPKFLLIVSHEDEQALMKAKGLLPDQGASEPG